MKSKSKTRHLGNDSSQDGGCHGDDINSDHPEPSTSSGGVRRSTRKRSAPQAFVHPEKRKSYGYWSLKEKEKLLSVLEELNSRKHKFQTTYRFPLRMIRKRIATKSEEKVKRFLVMLERRAAALSLSQKKHQPPLESWRQLADNLTVLSNDDCSRHLIRVCSVMALESREREVEKTSKGDAEAEEEIATNAAPTVALHVPTPTLQTSTETPAAASAAEPTLSTSAATPAAVSAAAPTQQTSAATPAAAVAPATSAETPATISTVAPATLTLSTSTAIQAAVLAVAPATSAVQPTTASTVAPASPTRSTSEATSAVAPATTAVTPSTVAPATPTRPSAEATPATSAVAQTLPTTAASPDRTEQTSGGITPTCQTLTSSTAKATMTREPTAASTSLVGSAEDVVMTSAKADEETVSTTGVSRPPSDLAAAAAAAAKGGAATATADAATAKKTTEHDDLRLTPDYASIYKYIGNLMQGEQSDLGPLESLVVLDCLKLVEEHLKGRNNLAQKQFVQGRFLDILQNLYCSIDIEDANTANTTDADKLLTTADLIGAQKDQSQPSSLASQPVGQAGQSGDGLPANSQSENGSTIDVAAENLECPQVHVGETMDQSVAGDQSASGSGQPSQSNERPSTSSSGKSTLKGRSVPIPAAKKIKLDRLGLGSLNPFSIPVRLLEIRIDT